MNVRSKITVDMDYDGDIGRLTIAPDDDNDRWTVFHHRILTEYGEGSANRHILSLPNSALNDLIRALTLYRDNVNSLRDRN
jgi:hypothetical protein